MLEIPKLSNVQIAALLIISSLDFSLRVYMILFQKPGR
jgi:hypothetical protein